MDDRTLRRLTERITIDPETGCWLWTAERSTKGYGRVAVAGERLQAHRVVYELVAGPIESGMQLDHLCRTRHCVNPSHMEPVTSHENTMRGLVPSANREVCRNGLHLLAEVGITVDSQGTERCRECRRESKRRYYLRRLAA